MIWLLTQPIPQERRPLYRRRSPAIAPRPFILLLTPMMEILSSASTRPHFIYKMLTLGYRWMDCSPSSVANIRKRRGIDIRTLFITFEEQNRLV